MDSTVAAVESFKFLGTTISQDLKWDNHTDSTVKKAQQRLYFLRQLRKFNLPQELLKQFYSAIIESVLCSSITVWFGSATKTDIRRLQRTVRTAERIIASPLPNLQDLYISRVRKRAKKVTNCKSLWIKASAKWLNVNVNVKSLWTPHTQHTLSLNCCPLADATDHWAPKQPDTRAVFSPRPYPIWTTHNTPQYCTSVNNSSNLHLYIGHMHIHSSCLWTFFFSFFHLVCAFRGLGWLHTRRFSNLNRF